MLGHNWKGKDEKGKGWTRKNKTGNIWFCLTFLSLCLIFFRINDKPLPLADTHNGLVLSQMLHGIDSCENSRLSGPVNSNWGSACGEAGFITNTTETLLPIQGQKVKGNEETFLLYLYFSTILCSSTPSVICNFSLKCAFPVEKTFRTSLANRMGRPKNYSVIRFLCRRVPCVRSWKRSSVMLV